MDKVFFAKKTIFFRLLCYVELFPLCICYSVCNDVLMFGRGRGVILGKDSKEVKKLGKDD